MIPHVARYFKGLVLLRRRTFGRYHPEFPCLTAVRHLMDSRFQGVLQRNKSICSYRQFLRVYLQRFAIGWPELGRVSCTWAGLALRFFKTLTFSHHPNLYASEFYHKSIEMSTLPECFFRDFAGKPIPGWTCTTAPFRFFCSVCYLIFEPYHPVKFAHVGESGREEGCALARNKRQVMQKNPHNLSPLTAASLGSGDGYVGSSER